MKDIIKPKERMYMINNQVSEIEIGNYDPNRIIQIRDLEFKTINELPDAMIINKPMYLKLFPVIFFFIVSIALLLN